MAVLVLASHQDPPMSRTERRARLILARGRARMPGFARFTVPLVARTVAGSGLQPLSVKMNPGSKSTDITLVRVNGQAVTYVLQGFDLEHRVRGIGEALTPPAQRRLRRWGNLHHRPKRFDNRRGPEDWELCENLGDGGLRKAAYLGRCPSLQEPLRRAIRHG